MEKPSRLYITRRNGESFVIGDDVVVTLHRQPRGKTAIAEIRTGSDVQSLPIKFEVPFAPCPDVFVVVPQVGRRSTNLRVMVEAPRHIRILRSELLTRASPA